MTEKRYYCDDRTEYRSYGIFDLSRADKSMDDFRDEDDDICMPLFRCYLCDETDSMLIGEEVVNRLNEQEERIKDLELFIKKVVNKEGEIILMNGYGYNIKKVIKE